MSAVKIELAKYDGRRGPIQLKQFLMDLTSIQGTNNVPDARMRHLVSSAFERYSPSWYWYFNVTENAPDTIETYQMLRHALKVEFSRPLTLDHLQKEESKLVMTSTESVHEFFMRVKYFHNSKDFHIARDVKAQGGYQAQFDYRVRDSFVRGLPRAYVKKFHNLNVQDATSQVVLQAALQISVTDVGLPIDVHAVQSRERTDDDIAAIFRREMQNFQARGGGGGRGRGGRGRGRGGGRGRGNGNASTGGQPRQVSMDELRRREKTFCNKCKKMVKHNASECFGNSANNASVSTVNTPNPYEPLNG